MPVRVVDPHHTSTTCPGCGTVDRENRPTRDRFQCVSRGFAGPADTIAAHGPPETLEQIAVRYRLSPERVRQIQIEALDRLRDAGRLLRLDVLARESELL